MSLAGRLRGAREDQDGTLNVLRWHQVSFTLWSTQFLDLADLREDVLGKHIDIHSGGIDLAFPHHDNELAQSEAYFHKCGKDTEQWINYFLHMGHLSIQGSKMSKSLKNFTTIREALDGGDWTPRSLRIAFLLGAWREGLEITDENKQGGSAWEDKVSNFFLKARDLSRHPSPTKGSENDADVQKALEAAQGRLDRALRDSFDTPTAMRAIADLITAVNSASSVSDAMTLEVAKWITRMVTTFGLDADPVVDGIGWSGIDIPEVAKRYIYPLSALRDEVRKQAIAGSMDSQNLQRMIQTKPEPGATADAEDATPFSSAWDDFTFKLMGLIDSSAPAKQYLPLCDSLRDTTLWDLGIYLEDRENQPAMVRPLNASLRQERANREQLAALKLQKAAAAKEAKEKEERERLEKGKLSHLEMFRTSEYSEWDAEGLPTKDAEGKELAKSRGKKLKKEWDRQKKLHQGWLAAQKEGA